VNDAAQPGGDTPHHPPVVMLKGEVDLAQAPTLREDLETLLAAGHSTVVVDMLDVSFLDSTALGVLVAALGRCQRAGGNLHLIVTEPRVLKVLEITGLADAFPLHPTRTGETTFAEDTDL
jgi:anti-sigma B factor antagonist